jgi:hypothetical protein
MTQRLEASHGSKSGGRSTQLGNSGPLQMMVLCGGREHTRYQ